MSAIGTRRAELDRQRLELLRLQRVRTQARAVVTACNAAIHAVTDPAVQQLAAAELRALKQELNAKERETTTSPDVALRGLGHIQKRLHATIARAEAAARKWSQQRTKSEAQLSESRAKLDAAKQSATESGAQAMAQAQKQLTEATASHQAGRYAEAEQRCREVEKLLQQADQASFDESVRREVVRGLLDTLEGMGFDVEGPEVQESSKQGGTVTLVGQLPSGRLARFEVQLDGQMLFDLDGYEGRSCGAELERIEHTLHQRFGVKLSPPQITWKNPDRISKGARRQPSGRGRCAG